MNNKEQALYSKFISLPEGIEKYIAWAKYNNYKRKFYKQKSKRHEH
jgi:hypothetical protein